MMDDINKTEIIIFSSCSGYRFTCPHTNPEYLYGSPIYRLNGMNDVSRVWKDWLIFKHSICMEATNHTSYPSVYLLRKQKKWILNNQLP